MDVVAIPTRDRPELLARCMSRLVEVRATHRRSFRVVVADDSADPSTRERTRLALTETAREHRVPIAYADAARKAAFVEGLLSLAPDLDGEVVRVALLGAEGLGTRAGANRNAILLETVGERILSIDDDMVLELAPSPDLRPGLRFNPGSVPLELWTFASREEAFEPGRFDRGDPLSAADALLGADLSDLTRVEAGAALAPALASAAGEEPAHVAAVCYGTVGHAGFGSVAPFLLQRGASRERLAPRYTSALASWTVLRAADMTTVTDAPFLMGGGVALDHRRTLPPFHPVGRNQDGLFAATMRSCSPASFIAHLPWAMKHAPPATAHEREPARRATFRICDLLVILALACRHTSSGGEARLAHLGARLQRLAASSRAERDAVLCKLVAAHASATLGALRELLSAHAEPRAWVEDCRVFMASLEGWVNARTIVPSDLAHVEAGAAAEILAEHLERFGRLLAAWPRIRAAAAQARSLGHTLAEPLG